MLDVSVIIVSYNTKELLRDCLNSLLQKTTAISYEVIVVDNDSQDGSIEMLADFGEDIRIVSLSENVGFGRANNEGIKVARGRNIFLLNPDTLLINNAVKVLSDFLDEHVQVAVCGGNLYMRSMSPTQSYMMRLPSLGGEVNMMLFDRIYKYKYGKNVEFNHCGYPLEVGYITGADMMIRKQVLDEVGYFDPDFFMYYEETELTYRIKKAGYKVVSVPWAKIQHLEGKSFKPGINVSRIRYSIEGRNTYYSLHYPYSYQMAVDLILKASVMIRILAFSFFRNQGKLEYYQIFFQQLYKNKEK